MTNLLFLIFSFTSCLIVNCQQLTVSFQAMTNSNVKNLNKVKNALSSALDLDPEQIDVNSDLVQECTGYKCKYAYIEFKDVALYRYFENDGFCNLDPDLPVLECQK